MKHYSISHSNSTQTSFFLLYMVVPLPPLNISYSIEFHQQLIDLANEINQSCRIDGGPHPNIFFSNYKKIPTKLNFNDKTKSVIMELHLPKDKIIRQANQRLSYVNQVIQLNDLHAYYHTFPPTYLATEYHWFYYHYHRQTFYKVILNPL